jgi:hypothetical protein
MNDFKLTILTIILLILITSIFATGCSKTINDPRIENCTDINVIPDRIYDVLTIKR